MLIKQTIGKIELHQLEENIHYGNILGSIVESEENLAGMGEGFTYLVIDTNFH